MVSLGDIADLGNSFSIGMWVKPTDFASSYNPLISRDGDTQYNFGLGFNNSGNIRVQHHLGDSMERGTCVAGNWQYVFTTVDNLVCKIYLNGAQQSSSYEFTGSFDDTGNMNLGGYSYTPSYFNGEINLPQIYSGSITPARVRNNYNGLKGRFGL
jgi:hypothetical protein